MQQLKDRERTEKAKFESALRQLYERVWLPGQMAGQSAGRLALEKLSLAGRPTVTTGIHERLMELLTEITHRVFETVTAEKIVALMHMGMGSDAPRVIKLGDVVDAFYEILDFPRLVDAAAIRQAVVEGVEDGVFGYLEHAEQETVDRVREGSDALIPADRVRISAALSTVQVDLRDGLIVIPSAIQTAAPEPEGTPPTPPGETPPGPGTVAPPRPTDTAGGPVPAPAVSKTTVRLAMRLAPQQIYHLLDPLINLAKISGSGSVRVTVEASKSDGFDAQWLHNAVLEPLDEADIDVTE
jgi:hypothetical protein